MQLVSKFSCRLNIERNGVKLLGPKFQSSLFNISMHDNNKDLTISITAKTASASLPPSAYIPKVFTHRVISQIFKQCIDQGRLSIILINYDSTVKGYQAVSTSNIQTCIFISEAPVEALRHFYMAIQQGPSKRQIMDQFEDRESIRKKPKANVWNSLNSDVIRVIFQFIGEKIGHFALVSRGWCMMISEMTRKVSFKYGKDITGEVIVRIIKRNPFLTHVSMRGCRNFQLTHMKKATTLPLKRVLALDLEGCKKINSQCLFQLIREGFHIESLNAVDTQADDDFFNYLNTNLHLKHIKELRYGNLGDLGGLNLSCKFQQIVKLEVHPLVLTDSLTQHLFSMENLKELKIYYQEVQNIKEVQAKCLLTHIEILQRDSPRTSTSTLNIWLGLKGKIQPVHVGCNLPKDSLLFLWEEWKTVKSLRLTEYCQVPESAKCLSLYYPEDLEDEIYGRTEFKYLSKVRKCELLVKSMDPYMGKRIQDYFKLNYPECCLNIKNI